MKSLTTEEFIIKAKEIHGNKYVYSKSFYENSNKLVIIICPEHGEFEQTPSKHLAGRGCRKCATKINSNNLKLTNEIFIERCKKIHGNIYDYSLTNYINSKGKVKIICPKHGVFEQLPHSHLNGSGCQRCFGVVDTISFIKRAKDVHGEKYDYSKVEYNKSNAKVKIICLIHGVFEQMPNSHLNGCGCPKCSNADRQKKQTSTLEDFINKAKEVHNNKYDYSLTNYINSKTKVKIICLIHGVFEQMPNSHLNGCGCPRCFGVVDTISFIKRAKDVHGEKYDYSLTNYINSKTKVKIICPTHGIFEQMPSSHLSGSGCPKCKSLGIGRTTEEFINEAKLIHGDKYDYSLVSYINTTTKIKIICPVHGEFKQNPLNHLDGCGCPKCRGKNKTTEEFINEVKNIHEDKYDYSLVNYVNSNNKIRIICPIHGEFKQNPSKHLDGCGCPKCGVVNMVNKQTKGNTNFINEAKLIHDNKYDYSLVNYISSHISIKIICPIHGVFEQSPANHLSSNGCPVCNRGWSFKNKLNLLNNLEHIDLINMDPIELSIIIGQGNLPNDFGVLVNTDANSDERITTLQELKERFSEEEGEVPSGTNNNITTNENDEFIEVDDVDDEITSNTVNNEPRLPTVNAINDLHSLDNSLYATMDEEAFESLIQYKLRKLWNQALNNETTIESIKNEDGGKYFNFIKTMFFNEYNEVINYKLCGEYSFKYQPNLMQKLTVHRLVKNKFYGNWSGTGAGKTLSFIIASREVDAKVTLIVALNSTIKQTIASIKEVYPSSLVFTDYQENYIFDRDKHNYIVLNYEKFQQEYSEELCQSLTNNNQIDFIVVDEVHSVKQRQEDTESIRHAVINRLFGRIRENNPNVYTLVMSATPVINNLYEAKSLLKLMNGLEYEDIQTRRSLPNALKIFQQLILSGLRFLPKYDININELTGHNMSNLNIDGSHLFEQLLDLPQNNFLAAEQLLLDDKLKAITPYLRKGVIIYSYFTSGIVNNVEKYVESLGFKCGTYTGEESTYIRDENLDKFKKGEIDILIGSKPIGTGVDGLQEVCDRMILITLPWTDSEYTQLKGRIYRQGSIFDNVEFIIPQVRIDLEDGEFWSWDIQRLNLIKNKKTLADAAVDGVIPSRILPTAKTMYNKAIQSLDKWKDRVNAGNIIANKRNQIQINLYPEINDVEQRQQRIQSELSEFNRRGKTTNSRTMHKEFSDNPESWFRYHALRGERIETWDEIPYEYIGTKIRNKNHVVVDFGCGENKFRHCIPNNKIYAFDHVAIDETVTACDIRETNLSDESIDVAVFSLALWGTNYKEYITEAYRVLNYGGVIHIAEPAKNYDTIESEQELINLITEAGFKVVGGIEKRSKFIYISGIKM